MVAVSWGNPGRRLRRGRGPVSRLGLECHKELLRAHDFLLNQAHERPRLGHAQHQGSEGGSPGPLEPPQSPPLCGLPGVLAQPCGSRALGVGCGPAPRFPLPALSLLPGGSWSSHPEEGLQEARRDFKGDSRCNGSLGESRPATLSPSPAGPGEGVVTSTASGER